MLSLLHPDVLASILEFPIGLHPVRHSETGKLLLILKIPKEYILTAREKGGFSFYLAPLPTQFGLTVALATAFFDDSDEPLLVKTPLFNEPAGHDFLELLSYDEFNAYFFDEHSREWMSYGVSVQDCGSLLTTGEEFYLLDCDPQAVFDIYKALDAWFGCRTTEDDAKAIKIVFKKELAPSDILIMDARYENHDYYGSSGFSRSTLEREQPGYFQERDIVSGLKRAFRGNQIAINPIRCDSGKEFVDVLAMNETHLLLVQAKDSPNTQTSLSRTLDRKRRTSRSQIEKAVKQSKGAAAYVRGHSNLELSVGKDHFNIDVVGKKIIILVIVQEIFHDETASLLARYYEMEESCDIFVILDYASFCLFCYEFHNEQRLVSSFADYSAKILTKKTWIDPRSYVLEARLERL